MRDFDRVRDKIEIRLEPRQVVMLAGATMIFSGLLFAAGFMLGRSRAPAPAPTQALATVEPAVEAPDTAPRTTRASAIGEVEFRFPSALGSRPGRARSERPAMKLAGEVVATRADEPAPSAAAPEPAPPAAKPEPPAMKPEPPAAKPEPATKPEPAPAEPIAAAPALRPIAPARAEPVAEPIDRVDMPPFDEDDPDAAPPPAAPAPAAPAAKATPDAPGARYTLQVKAARDKAEADAFVAELRAAGFSPHIVLADIPGKGRFYRVRVGRFASMGDARAFQRRYKVDSGQPDGGFVTDL